MEENMCIFQKLKIERYKLISLNEPNTKNIFYYSRRDQLQAIIDVSMLFP